MYPNIIETNEMVVTTPRLWVKVRAAFHANVPKAKGTPE
jgi:hypothetical protein